MSIEVSLQNVGNSRVYGILYMHVKPGKYPAMLRVPGAGVRPYNGDTATAAKGIIHLEIGIHGIPVTMPQSVYNDLGSGALSGYPTFNLDNRDTYITVACFSVVSGRSISFATSPNSTASGLRSPGAARAAS